jgi:probable phosphoglycerate mutase
VAGSPIQRATEGVRFAMDAASWAVLGHERGVPRLDHVNLPPKGTP